MTSERTNYLRVAIASVVVAIIITFVASFYALKTMKFSEDGWVQSKGEVFAVTAGKWHYIPKGTGYDAKFYPRNNYREVNFARTRDNGGVISGKVSVEYTYVPSNIFLSRSTYEDMVELWVLAGSLEVTGLENEADIAIEISNKIHQLSKGTGVLVNTVLLSSVEMTDPVVEYNKRKRQSRRDAQAAQEVARHP